MKLPRSSVGTRQYAEMPKQRTKKNHGDYEVHTNGRRRDPDREPPSEQRDSYDKSGRKGDRGGHDDDLEPTLQRLKSNDPYLTAIDWRTGCSNQSRTQGEDNHAYHTRRKPPAPGNPIGPGGASLLVSSFRENTTLSELCLDGHDIGDIGASSFLILTPPPYLDDGHGNGSGGDLLGRMRPRRHSSITKLRLRDNGIGPTGAEAISRILVDADAVANCANCSRRGTSSKRRGGNNNGDDGLSNCSNPCVTCSPSQSYRPTTAMATPILPNLVRLDLSRNPLGPTGVSSLARSLLHNSSLSVLVLSSTQAGDEGAQHLSRLLRSSQTLTTLRLRDNGITGMGACAVLRALWDNTTMVELDLRDNPDVGESGGVAAGDMLGQNGTLTWLRLGGCGLADLAAVAIASGLEAGGSVGEDAHRNGSSDNSSKSDGLPSPTSSFSPLAVLDLSSNLFTADGVKSLCSSLCFATSSLHHVDLSENFDMGDEGAYALADVLRVAPSDTFSIRELSLRKCGIGNAGFVAVGQAAMHCAKLEVLDLGGNHVDEEVASAVRDMLMGQHGTLKKLNLEDY